MKIKQAPDDFQVEELTEVVPRHGDYALYRLEKTGWTTTDALAVIRRRWKLHQKRLSIGGLKDRHARTIQYLTILHGPKRGLNQQNIRLEYIGQARAPFSSADIRSNHFRITVRSLSSAETDWAQKALSEVAVDGLPNYFDDQRFGSVSAAGNEFVAQHWIHGNYEQGLKLALTGRYEHDRAETRREKSLLRQNWGDWQSCLKKFVRSQHRRVFEHLSANPDDFRGAITAMRAEAAVLYLSAYQSHLWNRVLATWIEQHFPKPKRLPLQLKLGTVVTAVGLEPTQRAELTRLVLPLPSSRLHYEDAVADAPADWPDAMRSVLTTCGIDFAHLRLPGLRRPFFSRGERPMWFWPAGLSAEVHPDERHLGRRKLVLSFELPRGSYATLVLKRVTQNPAVTDNS